MAASLRNVCVKNIRCILCRRTPVSLKCMRCYTSKLTEKNEQYTKAIHDNEIILENNFYLVRLEGNVEDHVPQDQAKHQTDNINVSEFQTPDNNRIAMYMPFGRVTFDSPVIDINQFDLTMEKDKHKQQKAKNVQPSNYSNSSKELAYLMSKLQINEQPTNISLEEECEDKKESGHFEHTENKLKKRSQRNLQKQEKRIEKNKDVSVDMSEKIDMDLNDIPTEKHIIQPDNRASQHISYGASAIRKESSEKILDTANSDIKSRNVIPYQRDIIREEQTDGNKTNMKLVRNKDQIQKQTSTTSKVKGDSLGAEFNYMDQQYFEMVESPLKQDTPGQLSEKLLADGPQLNNYEITEDMNLNYVDQQFFETVESVSKEKFNTSIHNSVIPEISLEKSNEGNKDEKLNYVDQQYFGKNDPLLEAEVNIVNKKLMSSPDSLNQRSQEHEDSNTNGKINNGMEIEDACFSEVIKATTEFDGKNCVVTRKDVDSHVDTMKDVDSRFDTVKYVDRRVDTVKDVDSRVVTMKDVDSRFDTVNDSSEIKSSDEGSWIDLSKIKSKVVDSTNISSKTDTLKTTHQRYKLSKSTTASAKLPADSTHQMTHHMTALEQLPADSTCHGTQSNKEFEGEVSQPITVTGDVSCDISCDMPRDMSHDASCDIPRGVSYDDSQQKSVTGTLADNKEHYGGLDSQPMLFKNDQSESNKQYESESNKQYESESNKQYESESNKQYESESNKSSDKPKKLTRLELLDLQQVEIEKMISERDKLRVGNVTETNISDLMRTDEDEFFNEENASPAERVAKETRKAITGQDLRKKPIKKDSQGKLILSSMLPELWKMTNSEIVQLLKKEVLYNDNDMIVINKPYGLASHGGPGIKVSVGHVKKELARAIDPKLEDLYIAHRLDKYTTGVMILTRTAAMCTKVQKAFIEKQVIKKYWAITKTVPSPAAGIVDIPIAEGIVDSKSRMVLSPDYNPDGSRTKSSGNKSTAVTQYKVLTQNKSCALVEASPLTGVKHQIRVHLAFGLGAAILGDQRYAHLDKFVPQVLSDTILNALEVRPSKSRHIPLHLHCVSVVIPEFIKGRNFSVASPLPYHFSRDMKKLNLVPKTNWRRKERK